jgi:hypothetical protein
MFPAFARSYNSLQTGLIISHASPCDIDLSKCIIISSFGHSTLILAGEKDSPFAGQTEKIYDLLKCPKKYILFTSEEGAEDDCHVAALSLANQRIFDWLDDILQKRSS